MLIKNKSKRWRRSCVLSNKKSHTRKMGGGNIGVKVESGSPNRYINPINSEVNCQGCKSDNTTGAGSYSLNTPLPNFPRSFNMSIMKGGGVCSGGGPGNPIGGVCSQPPLQFLQKGGNKSRKMGKGHMRRRGRRGMKGGSGDMMHNFWSFMKTPFWSADKGGDVLAPSSKGITISGLGSPVSTAANPPMPRHQPWPYQLKEMPHSYQMKGGGRSGRNRKTVKKGTNRRGLKGGNIINDLQNIGRGITYNMGKLYNDFSGYSNKIYASNPIPSFGQFPNGLSENINKYPFNPPLQKIYNNSDLYAARI